MPNAQAGHQLYTQSPPVFDGFTVRGGTWTEKDSTKTEDMLNQDEETFNTTAWDEGVDAKCELLLDATQTLNVLDVITEVGGSARLFLIKSIEKKNFGKRALIFAVELSNHAAQDLTIIS